MLGSCLCVAALLAMRLAWQRVTPDFSELRLEEDSGARSEALLPLRWPTASPTLDVRLVAEVPPLHPRLYHFELRGCLEHLTVNGRTPEGPLPSCERWQLAGDAGFDTRVDLGSVLRPGPNTLEARIRSGREPQGFTLHTLNLRPSARDPLVVSLALGLLLLVLTYGVFLARQLPLRWEFAVPLLAGVSLRLLYAFGTSISQRAYDWHGHLVYVSYVAERLAIPPAQHGWETYQPPLYYALCAAWVRLGSLLGVSVDRLYQEDLRAFSLLLSSAALAVGLWVGSLLFAKDGQKLERLLFGSLLAALPGLVFFCSRVSNDALYHLLAFLFLALALRFWQQGQERDWWWLTAVIGVALLTKSNALLFVPLAFGCLLSGRFAPRRAAVLYGGSALIWLAMTGWYFALRFVVEGESALVGNMHRFDPSLAVPSALRHFMVFDPLEVLRHPYVDDLLDATRRAYFWEYLFRTAHFGGFDLASQSGIAASSAWLLGASMLLLPCAAIGFVADLRLRSRSAPLWMATLVLVGAQIGYRLQYPYSFNQDFRFSVLLALPVACYAVSGLQRLPRPLRAGAMGVALVWLALAGALVTGLAFDA